VLAWTSGGRVLATARIRSWTAEATVRLLAPIRIKAVPTTTSTPSSLAVPVRSSPPIPTSATSRDVDRHAAARRDHDVRDRLDALDPARGADDVGLAEVLDEAGAGADVVALEGLDHVAERQRVGDELLRVGADLVLLDPAADRVDTRDVGDALELRPDDPVLDRPQIGRAFDRVREPLALRREIGPVGLPAGLAVAVSAPRPSG
jgi:hypothetical protein